MDSFTELDFRDGRFAVPAHLAVLMGELETFRLTYKEAVAEANKRMQSDVIGKAMSRHVLGHFGGGQ